MSNAEIATNLLTYINKYLSYDTNTKTVNVDLQSFVNNIQPHLATIRAAFTSAVTSTYEDADAYTLNSPEELTAAVKVVSQPIDNMLKTKREELVTIQTRLAERKTDLANDISYKYWIDKASPADKKAYPKRLIIVALGTLAAVVMCIIVLLVMERWSGWTSNIKQNDK